MTKKHGSSSGIEVSPQRRRRYEAKRKAQETRWAAKAGPVTVRRVEPAAAGMDADVEPEVRT